MSSDTTDDQIARGLREARAAQAAKKPQAGSWTIMAGIVVGIIGGILMGVASSQRDRAQRIADLTGAMAGYRDYTTPAVATWTTWGHVGLGALIFGGALLLLGIALKAFGR